MLTLRQVAVFTSCCSYCDGEVIYTVPNEQMPRFEEIDASGDHRPICHYCDFYRQADLLAAFRVDPYSQPGQPAQRPPQEV